MDGAGDGVASIDVGIGAFLLDDEHVAAQAQDLVEVDGSDVGDRRSFQLGHGVSLAGRRRGRLAGRFRTVDDGSVPLVPVGSDIEIFYESFGEPDDPLLVLVGGLGNQLIMWAEELCWGFVDRGFRVVRFDNRDAGLSTRPPADVAYDLADMAGDIVGMLDALGVDAGHILGMSLGGMIAQTMAIDHPGRVASLTSVSSTTGSPDVGHPSDEVIVALSRPEPSDRAEAIESAVAARRVWSSSEWFDEEATRVYYQRQYERAAPANSARQLAAIAASGDREPQLAQLRVPTVVMHGADDPLIDISGGQRTAATIPGAELVIVDNMAHDLPVQMWPQLIAQVTALAVRSAGG